MSATEPARQSRPRYADALDGYRRRWLARAEADAAAAARCEDRGTDRLLALRASSWLALARGRGDEAPDQPRHT